MFCRQPSAVEGCAGPPHYHGTTLFSGANAVSALYFISWHKFITFVLSPWCSEPLCESGAWKIKRNKQS